MSLHSNLAFRYLQCKRKNLYSSSSSYSSHVFTNSEFSNQDRKSLISYWLVRIFVKIIYSGLGIRKNVWWGTQLKQKIFQKVARIRSHHLHLQWKFKLWAGRFAWGNKAKYCWIMSTNFLLSKLCWPGPAMFCLYTLSKISRP